MQQDSQNQEAMFLSQSMSDYANKTNSSDMLSWINHFLYSFALMDSVAPQESAALLNSLYKYMNDEITVQEYQFQLYRISGDLQDTFDANAGDIPIH